MNIRQKLLLVVAALMLLPLYYIPFWSISMTAPQYPEGIGMYIHINDVRGHNQHDIQSINTLNHYIGMKEIHVDEIPELKIMPYIFAFMIGSLILIALIGNQKLLLGWLILFVILSIAGIVDYYLWGYDYGHNLDPDAPIKVPGMSYQPPLIGTKQLLNIRASSYPTWGSALMVGSFMLSALIYYNNKKKS